MSRRLTTALVATFLMAPGGAAVASTTSSMSPPTTTASALTPSPSGHTGFRPPRTSAPKVPRMFSKMLVGARAKSAPGGSTAALTADYKAVSALMGGLDVTRAFHGTLSTAQHRIVDPGSVEIESYKTPQANLASYARSMAPQDLIAWWHEPEGPRDNVTPEAYRTQFVKEYNTAHAANPRVRFGQISGGYQWRKGNRGAGGAYLPPKGSADWLGFDTYRTGTDNSANSIVPISQMQEFQSWYAAAKTYGVPLYITEYGRGIVGVAGADAKRAQVLPQDFTYLNGLNFSGLSLWYSDQGPDGRPWAFTDAASINAVRAITSNR